MKFAKSILFMSFLCSSQLSLSITNNENKLTQADLDFIATIQNRRIRKDVNKFLTQNDPDEVPILISVIYNSKNEQQALEILSRLIKEYKVDLNIAYQYQHNTPLIEALKNNYLKVAKLLLANGADINFTNEIAVTPLIGAASFGNVQLLNFLLDQGAHIDAFDKVYYEFPNSCRGGTPITNSSALIHAATKGHYDVVRILLERGANIELQDKNGNTALIKACGLGNKEIVNLLLKYKADINIKNNDGKTAKDIAQQKGRTEIVKLLS